MLTDLPECRATALHVLNCHLHCVKAVLRQQIATQTADRPVVAHATTKSELVTK